MPHVLVLMWPDRTLDNLPCFLTNPRPSKHLSMGLEGFSTRGWTGRPEKARKLACQRAKTVGGDLREDHRAQAANRREDTRQRKGHHEIGRVTGDELSEDRYGTGRIGPRSRSGPARYRLAWRGCMAEPHTAPPIPKCWCRLRGPTLPPDENKTLLLNAPPGSEPSIQRRIQRHPRRFRAIEDARGGVRAQHRWQASHDRP